MNHRCAYDNNFSLKLWQHDHDNGEITQNGVGVGIKMKSKLLHAFSDTFSLLPKSLVLYQRLVSLQSTNVRIMCIGHCWPVLDSSTYCTREIHLVNHFQLTS